MEKAQYLKTSALVAATLFLTLQKGYGFFLLALLPFFLIAVIYHLIRMIQRPGERKSRGVRLAIWSATFALAGTLQIYWKVACQNDADMAVRKVLAHKERAGAYPASLQEVGLHDQHLKDKWKLRYSLIEGKPALTYPAPFMPLELYEYDFEALKWRRNAY